MILIGGKALVNDKTCAIILELLQGEGGINLATQEFMEGIRKICDENGILMICDEVQCGMGRTGNMFAWQDLCKTGYSDYGESNRKRNSGRCICNDGRSGKIFSSTGRSRRNMRKSTGMYSC